MPACADCPAGTELLNAGLSVSGADGVRTYHLTPAAATPLASNAGICLSARCPEAASNGSTFFAEVWFSAGRGASAVREVLAVQLRGDVANDTQATTTATFPVHLPAANRNWDRTTDEFTVVAQSGRTTAQGGENLHTTIVCTPAAAGQDCCAQVLGIVQLIYSAVTQEMHNAP